jgi:SAM-dependent methyltransferase
MKQRAASEWWQSYFDDQYLLEYEPLFTLERDRSEVARVIDVLGLPAGSRVLDVPCGQGRHAHLLAEAGFNVDGLDYSEHLLKLARKRGTGTSLRYTRGDMRKLPSRWTGRFDAVLNLFTSFGFFTDPTDDLKVIREFARTLVLGGLLVWHGGSRDGVMARFLARDWWATNDGTMIAHERSFDPLSGVLTIESTWRGKGKRLGRRTHRIRLYTATRLAELCASAGLIVEEAFDGFTTRPLTRKSSEMLLVARKSG